MLFANGKRSPHRALWAVFRLCIAVTLLLGPLQSGAHYFYCQGLGLLASDPCVRAEGQASVCPFQSVEPIPSDCCERITVPSVPEGARAEGPGVAPAAVVAILAASDYVGAGVEGQPLEPFDADRRRRPPRLSEQQRAQSMVFLT